MATRADELDRFRHDAVFYAGIDDFLAQTVPFIAEGVDAGEPILVVVSDEKIRRLRDELGSKAGSVRFADMAGVGLNPARIIPAWRGFVVEQASKGLPFRGIGEPIWAARSRDELDECERHEALLNLAFDGAPAWWLACPYDTESLPASVLEEAERNHPFLVREGRRRPSPPYLGVGGVAAPFDRPLPPAPPTARAIAFGSSGRTLHELRATVARGAAASGWRGAKVDDLLLAVSEVATNSIRHGGGGGTLTWWADAEEIVCEVTDTGGIHDPMAGRVLPPAHRGSGYGLWLANQVCDLVQIRTFASGGVVRLHVRR